MRALFLGWLFSLFIESEIRMLVAGIDFIKKKHLPSCLHVGQSGSLLLSED